MSAAVDFFGGSFLADPYPHFAELLRARPVFYADDLDYWVISRYDDCRLVLRDYETFSAANALAPLTPVCPQAMETLRSGGFRSVPTLPNLDPPGHTRTRRIANIAFTPRRVAAMEAFVHDRVRACIAGPLANGRADIVATLTRELPLHVIFQILGVAVDDADAVKAGSLTRLLYLFGHSDDAEQVTTAEGMAAFWRYCEDLAEDRRARPRDDFTTDLVHTPDESGQPLTQQEVATILFGLLLAGHETTTNLLGNGLRRLLEAPGVWEALRTDPRLIPGAVEEILRYDSSVIHWRRRTTRPVQLSGTDIPADADVLVCIGAANHDPQHFPDPERFDIRRDNAREHLSFGSGPHHCLGAPLARLEAKVVFEELTTAYPSLRLAPGQSYAVLPIIAFRGPLAVLVEWD